MSGTPPPPAPVPPPRAVRRRPPLWLLGIVGFVVLALILYLHGLFVVETDDATIEADTVTVTPKVAAYVLALHVSDNSAFKAGQLLVELDPRDFLTARDSAQAALDGATAQQEAIAAQFAAQAQIVAADASKLPGDRANLAYAQQEVFRYDTLARSGAGTRQDSQKTAADFSVQQAALNTDEATLAAARAQLGVLRADADMAAASTHAAQSALAQAKLNLSYTKIFAPVSGTVANRTVQTGNYVQPGQALLSAVPDEVFVIANFKETQLAGIRVGQPVSISVDAFPGLTLRGHVDSFQRGTGAYFALLPPENATGNFVKIIQRVPVKILLDGTLPDRLAPGMSVEVSVAIRSL
jgi:membrane fusion protein (multidrug efflux system)